MRAIATPTLVSHAYNGLLSHLFLAQRDGSASTPKALLEYTLNVFNVPLGVKPFIRSLFTVESADGIADTLSMISTCASLEVAKGGRRRLPLPGALDRGWWTAAATAGHQRAGAVRSKWVSRARRRGFAQIRITHNLVQ
ncbi:hypothetical protein MRX96_025686 [Rhipicephalus microplus]